MSSHILFEALSTIEEHENDSAASTTDVDETSLLGEEEKGWSPHMPRRSKPKTRFHSFRWIIDTLLLFTTLVSVLLLCCKGKKMSHASPLRQVGGDYTGAGPTFSTQITKFSEDLRYTPLDPSRMFSPSTHAAWDALLPSGGGHSPLATSPNETFLTTTLTHQLHCVYTMARIFSGVVLNQTAPLAPGAVPDDWHRHFMHCVDYLRQSVMCAGDVAVEVHEPDASPEIGPENAEWKGHHVCKNYGEVTEYLEQQNADGVRVVLGLHD